jgi:hypothetical protein
MPYGSSPKNNPHFPFLGPPQPVSPPLGQPHIDINFVQPSPIQQLQTFEQLNMENPSHPSNNAKNKGETETITTQDPKEITPNNTIPLGATKIKATKTPKGAPITINHNKGRTINFELTSLALFLVSMDIILTVAPKFPISNG